MIKVDKSRGLFSTNRSARAHSLYWDGVKRPCQSS